MVGRILIIKEEKFSPGPGIEPGSPALRAGAITTNPPGDPIREEFLLGSVDRLGALVVIVPARRAGDGFDSWSRREFFLLNY